MFKNSFEELLFLRFLSKNAEHQRKMNQKMLKTQRELVRIQTQKTEKTYTKESIKQTSISKGSDNKDESFELAEEIKRLNPFKKSVNSELKRKNVFISILLTLTLGPIGLLYSSVRFAVIMTIIFVSAVIIRVDYTSVWFIINATIVSIGIYQTLKRNRMNHGKNIKQTTS